MWTDSQFFTVSTERGIPLLVIQSKPRKNKCCAAFISVSYTYDDIINLVPVHRVWLPPGVLVYVQRREDNIV